MFKSIMFLVYLLSVGAQAANTQEYIREYSYNASETDSKVSARKAAMQQMQSLLIEELGVQVQSSFSTNEKLQGDEFSRTVKANYQTFAKALTKTKIIKQSWNGEIFYIKAAISVDTKNLINQMQVVYSAPVKSPLNRKEQCMATRKEVDNILAEINRPEPIQVAIEMSKKYPFDRNCHVWQFAIMKMFTSLLVNDNAYRAHLFTSVENEGSSSAGDLLTAVLRYAVAINPLSDGEFSLVLTTLQRAPMEDISSVISTLFASTKILTPEDSDNALKREAVKQTKQQLLSKLNRILELAKSGSLGAHKKVSQQDIISTIFYKSLNKHPELFEYYYATYAPLLSDSERQKFARNIIAYFKKAPNENSLSLLNEYIKNTKINRNLSKYIFALLSDLQKNQHNSDFSPLALTSIMAYNKDKMANIILNARTSQLNKNKWLISYNLPSKTVCAVKACAKKLFDKSNRVQKEFAEYLVSYGERAKLVEKDVIKRYQRFAQNRTFNGRSNLKIELLKIMGNIKSQDKEALQIMVVALGSLDSKVPEQAQATLAQLDTAALPTLMATYKSQSKLVQRRIVEIMARFTQQKPAVIKFLSSIKPGNNSIKYAIEDATLNLKG